MLVLKNVRFYCKHMSSLLETQFKLKNVTNVEAYNLCLGKRVKRHDITVLNPSTNEYLCKIPDTKAEEISMIIPHAEKAQKEWYSQTPDYRSDVIYKAAQKMQEHFDDFVVAEIMDSGKPLWEAKIDVQTSIDCLKYFAGLANTYAVKGQYYSLGENYAFVRREPIGIVGAIGVWNFPCLTAAWKFGPALSCGNALIYKPSPLTPLTAIMMAECFILAGLPCGCLNIINGGAQTGSALCSMSGIGKISFTGSFETGRKIAHIVSGVENTTNNLMTSNDIGLKRLTLELGGKSPLIIWDDVDIQMAVKVALLANFLTQGATCSNGTRVFVHQNIYDKFTQHMKSKLEQVFGVSSNNENSTELQGETIGDPLNPKTIVGATITESHAQKVLDYIDHGIKEGAKLLYGGYRINFDHQSNHNKNDLNGKNDGYLGDNCQNDSYNISNQKWKKGTYLMPTVFTDCTDGMRIFREEIFGSVMCIASFKTESEIIARANDTPFGLSAGICTKDIDRAHRLAKEIKAGTININTFNYFPVQIPFGGIKGSGYGHECGLQSIDHYTQCKSVYVDTTANQNPARIYCPFYDKL